MYCGPLVSTSSAKSLSENTHFQGTEDTAYSEAAGDILMTFLETRQKQALALRDLCTGPPTPVAV